MHDTCSNKDLPSNYQKVLKYFHCGQILYCIHKENYKRTTLKKITQRTLFSPNIALISTSNNRSLRRQNA